MKYLNNEYGEENYMEYITEEGFENFKNNISDKELMDLYICIISEQNGLTFEESTIKNISEEENYYQNLFKEVTKFEYKVINDKIVMNEVIFDDLTFNEYIELKKGNILKENDLGKIWLGYGEVNIQKQISENHFRAVPYKILKLENDFIYTNELDDHYDDIEDVFPKTLDPIPYSVVGVGPEMKLTVTYEGNSYTLEFAENEDYIVFDEQ